MTMATRCPACDTVFRITPQQLSAHNGQVRCGRCMAVFDGFQGLTTLGEGGPGEAGAAAANEGLPAGREAPPAEAAPAVPTASPPASASEAPAAEIPDFGLEPAEVPPPAAEAAGAGATPAPAIARRATIAPGIAFDPEEEEDIYPEAPRRRWPWVTGIVLLLLLLAAQGAYFYRSDLAVQFPAAKPLLAEACALAGCEVPLPQRPKMINIEASDLQVVDPARPGVIQLTATLRNHAGHDVGFPALDLVLTNTREHTLARRIFLPAEYVPAGRSIAAGIPAKGEVTVRLDLDTGDLNAAGFRLELLPAPRD